jgi:hypothetical protein
MGRKDFLMSTKENIAQGKEIPKGYVVKISPSGVGQPIITIEKK